MKTVMPLFLMFLFTVNAFADNQASPINCKVIDSNDQIQARSVTYDVVVPAEGPGVSLNSENLNIAIHVDTYLSGIIDPGKQIVAVTFTDNQSGASVDSFGVGPFKTEYNVKGIGELLISCTL